MAEAIILQEGEEPKDAGNFALVEQIPAPRGAPRYRVVAQGVKDDGPVGIRKTTASLELVHEWATRLRTSGAAARPFTCATLSVVTLSVMRAEQTVPDPLSAFQRAVMLRRIDPEHDMARFYSLMIERDLFGTVRLVRYCGRIGAMQGREFAQDLPTEAEAVEALERLAAAKRRRGYRDL